MLGFPKLQTTTGWLGHLSRFLTVGTPPTETFPARFSLSALRKGTTGTSPWAIMDDNVLVRVVPLFNRFETAVANGTR